MTRRHVSIATLAAEYNIDRVNDPGRTWRALDIEPDRTIYNDPISAETEQAYREKLNAFLASGKVSFRISCLWCREEANTWSLMNNHGGGHGLHHGHCIAQALTRNHVRYDAGILDPTSDIARRNRSPKFDHSHAVANLRRSIERAAELWAHLDPDWLRDARERLARHQQLDQAPAEHADVPDYEEAALW